MAEEEPPDIEQIKKDQEIIRKLQEQKKKEREQILAETIKNDKSKEKVKKIFEERIEKGEKKE
ncbi:MAG: hypothetical protein HWN67_04960 [Candidatus Helarchaeota archaeon]|nr:hypothetical protein [Candidatus Helarchaeota archaeon]